MADLLYQIFLGIIICAAITGFGGILAKISKIDFPGQEFLFACFWLGFAVILLLLQIWNLLLPVNWVASCLLLPIGIWGFCRFLNPRKIFRNALNFPMLAILFLSLWWLVSNYSMQMPDNVDSGLYHFNSVRWLNEYAIVPGLGNLHGRLAFNQSFFILPALLNFFPFFNKGYHLANALLLFMLLAQGTYLLRNFILLKKIDSKSSFFLILFVPVLATLASWTYLTAAPTPDMMAYLAGIILIYHFLRFLENIPDDGGSSELGFIIILSAAAITVKLSAACVGAISVLTAIWLYSRFAPGSFRRKTGRIMLPLAFAMLLGSVWITRGIIYSGYPVYPLALMPVNVEWKVPEQMRRLELDNIERFARVREDNSQEILQGWNWLNSWAKRLFLRNWSVMFTTLITIAASMIIVIRLLFFNHNYQPGRFLTVFIPPAGALAFWFMTAPDIRFAGALFWILAFLSVIIAFDNIYSGQERKIKTLLLFVCAILPSVLWISRNHDMVFRLGRGYAIPVFAQLGYFTIEPGIKVYYPLNQTTDGCPKTWDSPLPATPHPVRNFKLNGSDLSSGFKFERQE
ncbi:MAG: hypothetical protein WCI51_18135 [Lentisphaerota bacterium]